MLINTLFLQAYHNLKPYREFVNNCLQWICQFSIFIALLFGVTSLCKTEDSSPTIDVLLFTFGFVLPPMTFLLTLFIQNRDNIFAAMRLIGLNTKASPSLEDTAELPAIEMRETSTRTCRFN